MHIYDSYRQRPQPDFFPRDYRNPDTWVQRQQQLTGSYSLPAGLIDWLRDYNCSLGCDQQALVSIDKLETGGMAVVTGQQSGLLTGPLYTIYKAVTAVQLARDLEAQLGLAVVPVFWLASEDHDFNEIRTAKFPADLEPQVLKFPGEHKLTPAARIPLTEQSVQELMAELKTILPDTEFSSWCLDMIHSASQCAWYSQWCAGLLSRLFSGHGLVILDSWGRPVRAAAAPVFSCAVRMGDQVDLGVKAMARMMIEKGFEPGLDIPENHSHLFWLDGDRRIALLRDEHGFYGRRGEVRFSLAELEHLAQSAPWQFSPNVVLRPLVQELVLPVLAMIGGPGEAAYLAQLRPVFELFGLEMPPFVPRLSALLIEPVYGRLLEKYGLTVQAAGAGLSGWLESQLGARDAVGINQSFVELRAGISAAYCRLNLSDLDPQLVDLQAKNLNKVLEQVQFLEKRAFEAHNRRHKLLIQHATRLEQGLPVDQERQYNIFWYLNKYGPDLVQRLLEQEPGKTVEIWL